MPWHLIVRVLFVLAVAYAAVLVRPFTAEVWTNAVVGALLGLVIIGVETRLREAASPTCSARSSAAPSASAWPRRSARRSSGPTPATTRVAFLHSFIARSCFPYLGLVIGARKGEWLEPARLVALFRDAGPQKRYRILDTSVIIDGRIADIVRDRLPRRHARHPAVRAQGAAARRRLGRLAQAQPRPARPRHPAEDPEDVGRRRHDLRHRLSARCAKST